MFHSASRREKQLNCDCLVPRRHESKACPELRTKWSVLCGAQTSPADDGAGQAKQRLVDVVADHAGHRAGLLRGGRVPDVRRPPSPQSGTPDSAVALSEPFGLLT